MPDIRAPKGMQRPLWLSHRSCIAQPGNSPRLTSLFRSYRPRLPEEVDMQPTTIQSATLRISIVLAATVGIATSAAAQPQLAYAYTPHNDYIVFFDKDTNALTTSAARTVRMAAREAGSGHVIKLAGNPGRTSAVKAELVREGIPAAQI